MAGEWREVKLTKIADLMMGHSPTRTTYNEQGDGLPCFACVDFDPHQIGAALIARRQPWSLTLNLG
jgi:hypothetical protein